MEKLLVNVNLPENIKHHAVIAGLYHDFRYNNEIDDEMNVRLTVDTFMLNGGSVLKYGIERNMVNTIIVQTRYPYKSDDMITDLGGILRDADRLYGQVFCSTQMVNRLYLALGHKTKIYDFSDFIERNIRFIEEFRCFSEQGRVLYEQTKEQAIDIHKRVLWG